MGPVQSRVLGSSGRVRCSDSNQGPLGQVGEDYSVSFCSSDSPLGPKHREAGGQDPCRPQQVDYGPELGAPPHVSDTELGQISQGQSCPLSCLMQRHFPEGCDGHLDVSNSLMGAGPLDLDPPCHWQGGCSWLGLGTILQSS